MCLKKVAYRSPPPAPVRAPLAERPGSAVRRCNRSRADGAEPRPPNWEAGNRSNGSPHPSPKKRKTQKESVEASCRRCRSPCVLASPAAPPGRACSPCVGVAAAAGIRRRRPWQPRKRIRRNGAYVYYVFPKAFWRELAKGFNAALVAKVLKGRGHLDVEKIG